MGQVASADHEIDRFERTLAHKIADLLHGSRPAQIAARDRILRAARQQKNRRQITVIAYSPAA